MVSMLHGGAEKFELFDVGIIAECGRLVCHSCSGSKSFVQWTRNRLCVRDTCVAFYDESGK